MSDTAPSRADPEVVFPLSIDNGLLPEGWVEIGAWHLHLPYQLGESRLKDKVILFKVLYLWLVLAAVDLNFTGLTIGKWA